MANSLRAKIKKLHHDGKISAEECVELLEKLGGHDKEVYKNAFDEGYERGHFDGVYEMFIDAYMMEVNADDK